ncbi:MAG TPA: membrane-associated protein, partial [Chromatiaceae bacterium]|nr:membrane-associated protein [Chromatiaceae bacterium]
RLAILLLMLVGLIWLSAWSVRLLFRLLSSRASSWVQALLHWADLHPNMGRIAQALADPSHPDAATLAALAAALLGATAVLGASISAMLIGPDNLILNRLALDLGQSLRSPLADNLMVIL